MIANDSPVDKLAMVSRMLSYQQQQGVDAEAALSKIQSSLSDDYRKSIDALRKMIAGDENVLLTGYGAGPYDILMKLVKLVQDGKGEVGKLFSVSQPILRDAVIQARDYWSGYNSLIAYIGLLSVICAISILIYSVFVLPEFSNVFESAGGELPALTQFVLNGSILIYIILAAMTFLVLLSILSSYHINKRVAQFLPLNKLARYVPGLSKLSSIYSYFLYIQYINILQKAGLSYTQALENAAKISPVSQKTQLYAQWYDALQSSAQLGVLEQEIDYQASQINAFFNRQMIIVRERMALVMQVSLGLVIGTLVIAMYLPIFKLGTTV